MDVYFRQALFNDKDQEKIKIFSREPSFSIGHPLSSIKLTVTLSKDQETLFYKNTHLQNTTTPTPTPLNTL